MAKPLNLAVRIDFPDGSEKILSCASKGEAKRKMIQAMKNPIVQRLGALVSCVDQDGVKVPLL